MKGLLLKDLYNVKGFARQYVIVILAILHEKYIICVDLYGDSRWDDEHYNHEHG